jgi:hypothetical protein
MLMPEIGCSCNTRPLSADLIVVLDPCLDSQQIISCPPSTARPGDRGLTTENEGLFKYLELGILTLPMARGSVESFTPIRSRTDGTKRETSEDLSVIQSA